ncbi:MAG: NAD-dependent epimerase/dehydratase family protein [Sphingomonas sp.]|uniref:NAD-dependent epimerase/dehydratase family protein n=1 Tax=Sphingomonas sp. TaxID=28214 RepID=UPI0022744955|nr:NAD-dependent epimerase/dehydratase family protein [Sphingomonas sp.]MCX8477988.1 NAD-dependent epimerase/dehydratase family protein [Sphingomonas sp.]
MKVAITGATGFVGRHVMTRVVAEGYDPVPIVRSPAGLANEIVVGDLGSSRIAPEALRNAQCLIHLAARTHVMDEADPSADAYHRANVLGTRAVLDAAIEAGVRRIVFMSSIKAIGDDTRPGEQLSAESTPRPTDAYGRSKLEAENELRQRCSAAGIEWVIIRPPLVYGAGAKGNFERLIALIARHIPLPLASVRNRRSMIYVANLASATVRACDAPGAANRVLVIADTTLSMPDLLRIVGTALERPARLFPFPPALLRIAGRLSGKSAIVERLTNSLEVNSEDSFHALDWRPPITPGKALRETVASYREDGL